MKITRIFIGLIASIATVTATLPAEAAFTPAVGYQATELYSTSGSFTTIGGLSHHDGALYFGQFTAINSLNLTDNSVTAVGTVPSNAGNALVAVNPADGAVYTAFGTSYADPYPAEMGYMAGGVYQNQLDMDGIYDAAVNSLGELFISANPANAGNRIYQYDWATGATTEIAVLGGSSGGLAFDAADNLYCSIYDDDKVITFTAAEVSTGGLTMADANTALDLDSPGFLAFDDAGQLFASWLDASWTNHLGRFDVTTNQKLADVATGGGKMTWADDTLYTVDTDWSDYSSTVQAVTAVPEPSSALLLVIALLSVLGFSRRK